MKTAQQECFQSLIEAFVRNMNGDNSPIFKRRSIRRETEWERDHKYDLCEEELVYPEVDTDECEYDQYADRDEARDDGLADAEGR